MKQKLIKLNESHYIIVDDSEKTEGCFVYNHIVEKVMRVTKEIMPHGQKITHSTQPLEAPVAINGFGNYDFISLSEVEELINGYSVDYRLEDFEHERNKVYSETGSLTACTILDRGISLGFNAHKELVKDRLFTVDQAYSIWKAGQEYWKTSGASITFEELVERRKESLLPKTEWEVTFDEQGKLKLI